MTVSDPDRIIDARTLADPFAPTGDGAGGPGDSPLDALAAELTADTRRDPVVLPVPARPGWALRVRADIGYEELQGWRNRAKRPGGAGPDELLWAELVVGGSTLGLLRRPAEDAAYEDVVEGGAPVTFRSSWLQNTMGAMSPLVTVRKFVGNDAHLTGLATEILRASGWNDDITPVNPTSASSGA